MVELLTCLVVLLISTVVWVVKNVLMWINYNDTYIRIQRNPRLKHHMRGDPGVQFMQRGWIIAAILLMLLSAYGLS